MYFLPAYFLISALVHKVTCLEPDDILKIALLAPEDSPVQGLNISSSVVALYLSELLLNESGLLQEVKYR